MHALLRFKLAKHGGAIEIPKNGKYIAKQTFNKLKSPVLDPIPRS